MSLRSRSIRMLILPLAGCFGVALLGACSGDKVDSPTTQSAAALSANQPGKPSYGFNRGPEAFFAHWDQDGDGKVALADLPERLRSHLAQADTNHDGILTRDELVQAHQAKRAEWQKKVDTNGDGVVSDEERAQARAAFRAQRFAAADKNHDGALTADEVPARHWEHIKVADANKDGKVTAEELDAAIAAGVLKPPVRHHDGHAPNASPE